MVTRYVVDLTEEERLGLEDLAMRKGISTLKAQRARILLKADEDLTDSEIAEDLGVGTATVERIRKRAVLEGIAAALDRRPQRGVSRPHKLDARAEAHLVKLACSAPPEGCARWTLSLLGDKLVELNLVDSVSKPTIYRALKRARSRRGR